MIPGSPTGTEDGPAAIPARVLAVLTVNLGAVAANYRLLRSRVRPGCAVAAMIKADGYGLGAAQVRDALRTEGCRDFFVATPEEAFALPPGGADETVAVLGGFPEGAEDECAQQGFVPVLNGLEDIARWRAAAARRGSRLPAMIHFDTGMNRLGLGPDETARLLDDPDALLAGIEVRTVMSHFACADEKDHPLTRRQHERFLALAARFPGVRASLANSSGIFRNEAYHFGLVRPGMALYGLNPLPEQDNPMKPAVTAQARILQVRTVAKGECAGYGASYRFEKDTPVATVALGYADGFLRSLGNRGILYYNGRPCPVRGRVSMDLTIVETGHLPASPRPGEMMEVIGPHQSADALADSAGTIGYEILTGLGRRYHRVYKDGDAAAGDGA